MQYAKYLAEDSLPHLKSTIVIYKKQSIVTVASDSCTNKGKSLTKNFKGE